MADSEKVLHGPGAEKRARPTLGLALGGGAARCVAHIGVLQVLEENGIPIHLIAGTSGGALVGALFAAGLTPKWLAELADRLNWRHIVKLNLRRDGLLDTEGLERFVATLVKNQTFADLRLPFAAVAVDLLTGDEVILQEGAVAPAVRASSSIPGIFAPVPYRGRLLVDGGVRNNVPVSLARAMGADVVIAVDVVDRQRHRLDAPRNLIQVMMASYDILQAAQVGQALEEADVVVRPDASRMTGFDLEHAHQYVELGREATELALPQIRSRLEEAQEGAD